MSLFICAFFLKNTINFLKSCRSRPFGWKLGNAYLRIIAIVLVYTIEIRGIVMHGIFCFIYSTEGHGDHFRFSPASDSVPLLSIGKAQLVIWLFQRCHTVSKSEIFKISAEIWAFRESIHGIILCQLQTNRDESKDAWRMLSAKDNRRKSLSCDAIELKNPRSTVLFCLLLLTCRE